MTALNDVVHLLETLKHETTHGYLDPEVIADYANDKRNPPENVPAQAVYDQTCQAIALLETIPTLTSEDQLRTWTQIQELLVNAANGAARCEEYVVGDDPENTAELESNWNYVQNTLQQAAAAAGTHRAYWQGRADAQNS